MYLVTYFIDMKIDRLKKYMIIELVILFLIFGSILLLIYNLL